MLNGEPLRMACHALRATGTRPTSVVSTNRRSPHSGVSWLSSQLAIINSVSSMSAALSRQRRTAGTGLSVDFRLKPAWLTACSIAGRISLSASTSRFSLANITRALATCGSFCTAVSILRAQLGQSMPAICQRN